MTNPRIDCILYSAHFGDMKDDEVDVYAVKLEKAVCAAYPDADVEVTVKHDVSGAGSGTFVSFDDDEYHGPEEDQIRDNVEHIGQKVLEG